MPCWRKIPRPLKPLPNSERESLVLLLPEKRSQGFCRLSPSPVQETAPDAPAPLPMRAHLFFRNVLGLWACADPQCPEVMKAERDWL